MSKVPPLPPETTAPIKILICGCGNAVHVLTSYLGEPDHNPKHSFQVNILSSHASRLVESLPQDERIRCINDQGKDTFGKANLISSDASQVVPGMQIILFALPTDRHEVYLKQMLPYLSPRTLIGSMPGESGFDLCVRDVLGAELADQMILFSLDTLPWACRIEEFGHTVKVLGTKQDIDLCVYPSKYFGKVTEVLQAIVGNYPIIQGKPTSNFLGCSLMNPNAVAHPCIEYGILRNWDGKTPFDKPPLFYQGVDDFTADLITDMSNEIMTLKKRILDEFPSIDLDLVRTLQEIFENYYYNDIADHSSLRAMFASNKGYDGLTMPCTHEESGGYMPLFQHRYFSEDLPCGILVVKGIAELARIETPVIDKVIYWCQDKVDKEYLVDGKLTGKDVATTKTPQRYGFKDLKTFVLANGYVESSSNSKDQNKKRCHEETIRPTPATLA